MEWLSVRNAAVTGDGVGGKVGKENTDKLTGKTTSCHPEKVSGPRPSAAETHRPGRGVG